MRRTAGAQLLTTQDSPRSAAQELQAPFQSDLTGGSIKLPGFVMHKTSRPSAIVAPVCPPPFLFAIARLELKPSRERWSVTLKPLFPSFFSSKCSRQHGNSRWLQGEKTLSCHARRTPHAKTHEKHLIQQNFARTFVHFARWTIRESGATNLIGPSWEASKRLKTWQL